MAEKIVSPGVFTRENDLSFVQQGVGQIGAAIVGPTVKGPALIPTKVFTYSEYQAKFGDSFKSGSDYYQYFTSITAKEYLKHGGPLTVTRILPGNYNNAESKAHFNAVTNAGIAPSGSEVFDAAAFGDGGFVQYTQSNGTAYLFRGMDAPIPTDDTGVIYYFEVDTTAYQTTFQNLVAKLNAITPDTFVSQSTPAANPTLEFTSSVISGDTTLTNGPVATFVSGAAVTATTNGISSTGSFGIAAGVPNSMSSNLVNYTSSFNLKTIGDGLIMNSTPPAGTIGTNDLLTVNDVQYGTKDNLRWEVNTINEKKGTFTVLIRRGDDTKKRKVILETFNACSLDPQTNNYIGNIIGTSYYIVKDAATSSPFLQPYGSWPNRSKYVYLDEPSVLQTVDYLDDNGSLTISTATGSLPQLSSGSFNGGTDGDMLLTANTFYENAGKLDAKQQGIDCTLGSTGTDAYNTALNLLSNADEYDVNLLMAPGINDFFMNHIVEKMLTVCEERGDVMTIVDPVPYGQSLAQATVEAGDKDSSYGAMYWPWVQIADPATGRYVWVPQSAIMPGIYAFNDKVSAEWFAPAGLNRGGQEIVVQAERKLTHANRDELYEANVNPIATFPGEGVVVWGQKTLQKKASALDRVNVRRLLINLKKFIASVSKYLIFENNTAATRNRFLSQVNPYMESVQQRQGLYAFKVIMDESNNTPDVIDRNIMKGDIFIQPAKAAEFIVIDFNIMPTGATFND